MDTPGAVYTGLIQQEIRLLLPLSLSLPVLSELSEAMPLSALNGRVVQCQLTAESLRNPGRGGETCDPDPLCSVARMPYLSCVLMAHWGNPQPSGLGQESLGRPL